MEQSENHLKDQPFYKNGLPFTCQRCSKCCRHEPGYVFLSENDLTKLVRTLKVKRDDFIHRYCRTVSFGSIKRISLQEKSNFDCIFWEQGKCMVYQARPLQCVSYPFWAPNLANEKVWNDLKKDCPGIGIGKVHSFRSIEKWLEKRRNETFLSAP